MSDEFVFGQEITIINETGKPLGEHAIRFSFNHHGGIDFVIGQDTTRRIKEIVLRGAKRE